jgi:RNA polymerase primary sigma factor
MLLYEESPNTVKYFNRIKNYKPLTKKEETALFRSYRKHGNLQARDKLVHSNLKYVVSVARNYGGRGVPFDDLISIGNFGLMKGIEKFDETRENKLLSYATNWIRFYMEDAVKKNASRNEYSIINQEAGLPDEETDHPNCDDLSSDDGYGVIDETFDSESDDYYRTVAVSLLSTVLDERERDIIRYTFGIDDCPVLTLMDISKKMNVSQERIRQIRENAMRKLRSSILEHDPS